MYMKCNKFSQFDRFYDLGSNLKPCGVFNHFLILIIFIKEQVSTQSSLTYTEETCSKIKKPLAGPVVMGYQNLIKIRNPCNGKDM